MLVCILRKIWTTIKRPNKGKHKNNFLGCFEVDGGKSSET